MCKISLSIVTVILFSIVTSSVRPQGPEGGELVFEGIRRVNAHGDEFNGLAKSVDGQRVFVATEKGNIIIWNITSQRIERTLQQPSAVHLIAALPNPNEIIAAGSNHHAPVNALVRKWNVVDGTFVDLTGVDEKLFPTALATNTQSGLIALGTADGNVVVWDAINFTQITSWKLSAIPFGLAIVRRKVYVATLDRESVTSSARAKENSIIELNVDLASEEPRELLAGTGGVWLTLQTAPDGRLLSAAFQDADEGQRTMVIDPDSRSQLGSVNRAASTWIDSSKLLLFDWLDPSEIVQLSEKQQIESVRKFERMETDTEGRAFDLTGQVASSDGSKAWASYRKGPGFLEFDLLSNRIRTLIKGASGAYAISVVDAKEDGPSLLTGGADGYIRLWKLSDLSLIGEYKVALPGYFVSQAHLLSGASRAVVEVMPVRKSEDSPASTEHTKVIVVDFKTGDHEEILDIRWWRGWIAAIEDRILYPDGNRIRIAKMDGSQDTRQFSLRSPIVRTAVSTNGQRLAVLDAKKTLSVFNVATGRAKRVAAKTEESGPLVVTEDGRYVYQIASAGELTRWDMKNGGITNMILRRVRDMHSRVDFMTLANGDKWLVTAGNHGDVGIFERETGRLVCYTQTSAAAFFVEKVWVSGNRMIFTTDTGVMIDGMLKSRKGPNASALR